MKTLKEIEDFIVNHDYYKTGNEAIQFDKETEKGIEIHIFNNCELANRHDYKTEGKNVFIYSKREKKYKRINNVDRLTTEFLQDLTSFVKE